MGVGGIIYLFTLSPKLAGMLLLDIPLVIGPIVLLGRRVRTFSRASQDRIADLGALISETLGAMKIVQAFTQESRSEEHTSELQSLMRISYAVFCLQKKNLNIQHIIHN